HYLLKNVDVKISIHHVQNGLARTQMVQVNAKRQKMIGCGYIVENLAAIVRIHRHRRLVIMTRLVMTSLRIVVHGPIKYQANVRQIQAT
uniref:Uncharacterized protein n=1 Tax=Acrobeloides nanus TaxID=290746 RepID=A0A914D6I8_9BILA